MTRRDSGVERLDLEDEYSAALKLMRTCWMALHASGVFDAEAADDCAETLITAINRLERVRPIFERVRS